MLDSQYQRGEILTFEFNRGCIAIKGDI